MKLLVDSGSTKANWGLSQEGQIIRTVQTPGISPYFLDDAAIIALVNQLRLDVPTLKPDELYFYSTGCNALEQRQRMTSLFRRMFPEARIVEVQTDILGAARASCQHHSGVVGILGTGSNACRYEAGQVAQTAGGLGFILGDEGSGAAIGKDLIVAYLNQELEPEIAGELQEEFHLTRDNILQSVYQLPFPNRFLATFAPFVHRHRKEAAPAKILDRQFRLFFKRNIMPLRQNHGLPVHFIGSVAFHFQEEVKAAAQALNIETGNFDIDPMPGLARYHQ